MAVDYCQRKAAKKQRRRLNDGKKSNSADGAAGGEGGSGKDKKTRPKRGRSGPRRLCQGMCFQVPKLLDDDIPWRSNNDDGERGAKVYDPRAPPPPREAERAAAAAARLLESGAAEAKVILEKGENGGGAGAGVSGDPNKRKRNRKKDHGGNEAAAANGKAKAPATPKKRGGAVAALAPDAAAAAAAAPPRLSTGASIAVAASAPSQPNCSSSHPTLDRSFDLSTLPLSLRMLAAACGLEAPTRVQSSAWAAAMKENGNEEGEDEAGPKRGGGGAKSGSTGRNKNLLIVAPPGAGKTLAYLLPAAAKVVMENDEDDEDEDEGDESNGDDGAHRRARAKKASSTSSSARNLPSPRVLVLVPTRELARQVAAVARPLRKAAGLKVVRVAGGDRREDQVDKLKASAGGGKGSGDAVVHVLVATPGRLLDLVRGGDVGLGSTRTIVLDEADRMLSSAGIAEQLAEIRGLVTDGRGKLVADGQGKLVANPSPSRPPQCMLVSATMPASVSRMASSWLGEGFASVGDKEERGLAGLQTDAPPSSSLVTQVVTVCAEHKKPAKLLKHLARAKEAAAAAGERHAPRVLIFANRIKTVKFIADFLRAQERKQLEEKRKAEGKNNKSTKRKGGSSASSSSSSSKSDSSPSKIETLHGDRTQPERDAALAAFRAGKVTTLVATDVAARGLDVSGLRHVVNYDFPSNLESYEHRVGRAGRDGRGGHVASFFGRPLAPLAKAVVEFLQRHGQGVDPNLVRLAEAYETAKRKLLEEEEGQGGQGDDDEQEEEEEEQEEGRRERSRRSAAARAAAAESKSAAGSKKRKKVEDTNEDEDDEVVSGGGGDSDDDWEEGRAAPVLGLYKKQKAAKSTLATAATAATAAMVASKTKKQKRKAVPGRLRQKLRREKKKGRGELDGRLSELFV